MAFDPSSAHGTEREYSDDALFDGGLRCRQHRRGYRFSVDAILAAHFTAPSPAAHILDLGAGCGIIGLICLYRWRQRIASLSCLELQSGLAALAAGNMLRNGFAATARTVQGDLRSILDYFPAESFTQVICNPPFYRKNSGRANQNEESFLARHQVQCTLPEVTAAAAAVVKNRGRVVCVYPAPGLSSLFAALNQSRLAPRRMQMVHSYPEAAARLVLVESVKNGGEVVQVLPPLYVYESCRGPYSKEMQKLYAPETGSARGVLNSIPSSGKGFPPF